MGIKVSTKVTYGNGKQVKDYNTPFQSLLSASEASAFEKHLIFLHAYHGLEKLKYFNTPNKSGTSRPVSGCVYQILGF